eukprot:3980683-Pyramimonas_sp.AAC.1
MKVLNKGADRSSAHALADRSEPARPAGDAVSHCWEAKASSWGGRSDPAWTDSSVAVWSTDGDGRREQPSGDEWHDQGTDPWKWNTPTDANKQPTPERQHDKTSGGDWTWQSDGWNTWNSWERWSRPGWAGDNKRGDYSHPEPWMGWSDYRLWKRKML